MDNLFVKKNTINKNICFDGEDLVAEAEYHEKMLDYDSALYCYKRAFKLTHKLWIKNRMLDVAEITKKQASNTKKPKIYKSKTPKLKKCKNCGVTLSKKNKKCPICHEKL